MTIIKLDEIKYALQNLSQRKTRSFLSIVSILIGIAAVFALISFGMGIKSYINTLAEESGTNKLLITAKGIGAPGTDDTFALSQEDVDFVDKINGIDDISGMYYKISEVTFRDKNKYIYMIGLNLDKIDFIMQGMNIDIEKGRALKKGDAYKAVLGYNYILDNKVFSKGLQIGDKIFIDDVNFEVIGFYSSVGNPTDDSQIYITSEMFEQLYPDKKDKYAVIMASTEQGFETKEVANKVTERLRKFKGQEEGKEDFYVQTFEDAIATFSSVINILNGVLVLIALISVVVASVNIMNTMYTSVLERTKEIGIMKAVGARNNDILFIFLLESGAIGMLGGIIGVLLGYAVASIGAGYAAGAGFSALKPIFPWTLIAGCILFSFAVGAGSGLLPAIRASKLKPVDSLRYE
ncbi:ABC transporter permease [Candidatus Woesearchaeota archaeon]|nr:ABC transporter permease [Candidatus Woesearchaeota archaeon]